MSIAHSLYIKYGLGHTPTDAEIARWLKEVERLIAGGVDREAAGRQAAGTVFHDAGTHKYASQAETIEALLKEAKKK
jgi:hypothetical protein